MVMATMRRVALRHGLQALLHEKPFAGINGSGKHCNWSMAITADNELDGLNLLKPGKTPHQNVRFLAFLAAVLRGVHKHSGLLRAGIATSGNEHRLGANEAPPAIISVFMGDMLTRLIDNIIAGKEASRGAEQELIKLGVAKLPDIEKDNTDRNRTSPFAFTGNKFEFRAVGSSQSIAFPITLLHAAVADGIGEITEALKAELKKTKSVDDAVLKVVRAAFKETAAVRFEGNNYSDEWVVEAEKRGLLNLRQTPDALPYLVEDSTVEVMSHYKVLSHRELESRYEVFAEQYVTKVNIEAETAAEMARTMLLPAGIAYLVDLGAAGEGTGVSRVRDELSGMVDDLVGRLEELDVANTNHPETEDVLEAAKYVQATVIPAMDAVREVADKLEKVVSDDLWPLPKYSEILFIR
jgi:glutamine synthetase